MAKKKKNAEPDLITLAELARCAGVSRAAVTIWIKEQEKQGIILAVPFGRRGKLVDKNNKLVMRYINNTNDKANRPGQESKNKDNKLAPPKYCYHYRLSSNTLKKLYYRAEKLRLENIAMREKYISTEGVFSVLDEFLKKESEYFDGISEKILNRIEAEIKTKLDLHKRKQVKEIIDNAINDAHITNERIIADFKEETKPRYD